VRAPFVDLRVRRRRGIDDRSGRARVVRDTNEVVEDRLGGQLLDDARARATTGEPCRDDRDVEPLERTCDVDALATRERQSLARTVTLPELEVRDGEGAVDGRVEGDGDDQVNQLPM
jgi:hypothetical protein